MIGIALIAITVAIAAFVRRAAIGIVWLALVIGADLVALAVVDASDPRARYLVPHAIVTFMLFAVVRALWRWRDDGQVWAIAAWQLGALATLARLSFFDGFTYTWWNWIVAIPANLFLAEIWPIYWLILRPLFGP